MERLANVHSEIYDHFHGSAAGPEYFFKKENEDRYAAYYTAMYLLQDTGESVGAHMSTGFSAAPLRAYIEIWGVMQALRIQQDAICELREAVAGARPNTADLKAWTRLRDLCTLIGGHPSKRAHGVPAPQRAFAGRMSKSYERFQFELWDAHTRQSSHPIYNLRRMIEKYDVEAAQVLRDVLGTMRARWPLKAEVG